MTQSIQCVIVAATHVIAVQFKIIPFVNEKYNDLTGNSSQGQYGDLFAVVGISLSEACCPRNDPKE